MVAKFMLQADFVLGYDRLSNDFIFLSIIPETKPCSGGIEFKEASHYEPNQDIFAAVSNEVSSGIGNIPVTLRKKLESKRLRLIVKAHPECFQRHKPFLVSKFESSVQPTYY